MKDAIETTKFNYNPSKTILVTVTAINHINGRTKNSTKEKNVIHNERMFSLDKIRILK
jgi:hypothetical protein